MEIRKLLLTMLGITQGGLGVFSGILTIMLGLNIIEVQAVLTVPPELLPLYILFFGLFSIFSVINAFFLVRK
jgi:hypothetical protein